MSRVVLIVEDDANSMRLTQDLLHAVGYTTVEAMTMSVLDYITKPFEREEVVQKVRRAIQSWWQLQQKRQSPAKLRDSITEHTERMQSRFDELAIAPPGEHRLLRRTAASQPGKDKAVT